jgi:hypothetical protein
MTYSTSFFHGYGVRLSDDHDWSEIETIGYEGPVFPMLAGDYDADWMWLFVKTDDGHKTEIELGTYVKVEPFRATDAKYPEWDWSLVDTAQKHGLKIADGPGWFFVPDYS